MTATQTADLFAKYEKLFEPVEVRRDMTKSCMHWGFECGNGWYDLIDRTLQKILDTGEDVAIVQVKEKFGGLRIYYYGGSDEIEKIVSDAETESYHICEICGKPGEVNKDGWLSTRCDECRDKR